MADSSNSSSASSSGRRRGGGRPPSSGNQRPSGSGSRGGGGGSGSARSGGRPSSGARSGSRGNNSRGRSGGSGRSGGQGGGRNRSGSGGSQRSGSGGGSRPSSRSSLPVVVEPVVTIEPGPAPAEEAVLARQNRRRGLAIAALPGVVVGIVVAVVCLVLIEPVVAVVAGVVIGIVIWVGTWWGATPALVRALHAEPADEDDYARVFNQMEGLCATMGLALPTVRVVEDEVVDALVIGRRRRAAVLVVTSGLAEALDPVQLEGVLAHELVHVKCADIVPATVAAAVALPLVAFLPGMANLVHMLAGRGREFRTDQMAVSVTRYPPGLREALALMVDGPVPRAPSLLGGRGVALVTRWLWTASLPDANGERRPHGGAAGDLDDVAVRIAALDEW